MNEEQKAKPNSEKTTSGDPTGFTEAFEVKESRRKRQTIKIKIPRKPAAPPVAVKIRFIPPPTSHVIAPPKVNDLPLRITAFIIMALLVVVYSHFFFDFIRLLPVEDFLPRILWAHVIHKFLGIALLIGFGLFETTRKGLTPRSRWVYCIFLACGMTLFVVQWVIRW